MKELVLVGGGHSHVAVLRAFGLRPEPGVRLTLVSRDVKTPYSGMLPGLIAGHYTERDAHIDLRRLAGFAGARLIVDEAIGLDLNRGGLRCRRETIPFDILSVNVGSTPRLAAAGAAAHALPVKPIDRFLNRWEAMCERLRARTTPQRVAVVGAGAGGVELTLAVEFRLRQLAGQTRPSPPPLEFHLFAAGPEILPGYNARVRWRFGRVLADRRIAVHVNSPVASVSADGLLTDAGDAHQVDEVLWVTEAAAQPWIAQSGLDVDAGGFITVTPLLRSTSHPMVFAAGDVAAMVSDPRPKSGVFAVRQGPPLARNLRAALTGNSLRPYHPQRQYLSLISTGDRHAIASRGPLAWEGDWVWRWKDWIDRRFMRTYNQLPPRREAP